MLKVYRLSPLSESTLGDELRVETVGCHLDTRYSQGFWKQKTNPSSADMTKLAMIAIHNNPRMRELGCHLLVPVHDEVICECPEENAKEVSELLSALMVGAAKERIRVPMKCDVEVTKVWYGDSIILGDN